MPAVSWFWFDLMVGKQRREIKILALSSIRVLRLVLSNIRCSYKVQLFLMRQVQRLAKGSEIFGVAMEHHQNWHFLHGNFCSRGSFLSCLIREVSVCLATNC